MKKKQPITKDKDVLYIDLVLALDELVERVEKAKSRKFLIFCFIALIFLNVLTLFISTEYILNREKSFQDEEKSAEIFLDSFKKLNEDDREIILKTLKKGV